MTKTIDFEAALRDPAAHFSDPESVTSAPGLDKEQKIAILRQWAYDENEIAVAQEEGMAGTGEPLLRRIAVVLAELDPTGESLGSTKHKVRPTH